MIEIGGGAAAGRRRRMEQEEEEMTMYSPQDLNQYEFKIVRSLGGAFRNPQKFKQLLQEESQAGWDLVEKLDNRRVRLKRPIGARERDGMLPAGVDPYRSYFGMQPLRYVLLVLLVVLLGMGMMFGTIILVGGLFVYNIRP